MTETILAAYELHNAIGKLIKDTQDLEVKLDFTKANIDSFHPWRGAISHVSLDFDAKKDKAIKATKLLEDLRHFCTPGWCKNVGYKGNESYHSWLSPVWADEYGASNGRAVIGAELDESNEIVLITEVFKQEEIELVLDEYHRSEVNLIIEKYPTLNISEKVSATISKLDDYFLSLELFESLNKPRIICLSLPDKPLKICETIREEIGIITATDRIDVTTDRVTLENFNQRKLKEEVNAILKQKKQIIKH